MILSPAVRCASAIGLLVTLFSPEVVTAHAQASAALSVTPSLERQGGDVWRTLTSATSDLRVSQQLFDFRAGVAAALSGPGPHIQQSNVSVSLAPPAIGSWRWMTDAQLGQQTLGPGHYGLAASAQSALSAVRGNAGVWIAAAIERLPSSEASVPSVLPRVGIWRQLHLLTVSVSATAHSLRAVGHAASFHHETVPIVRFDTISQRWDTTEESRTYGDTTTASNVVRWTELTARLGWSAGRFAFDGTVAYRPHLSAVSLPLAWSATAAAQLSRRLSLVVGSGVGPAQSSPLVAGTRTLSFGLRVAPAALIRPAPPPGVRPSASSFELSRLAARGEYEVRVRVPNARTVELSGDFDHWRPIMLEEVRPDDWRTTISVPPGTYRVNVRVNGERWTAPPGLPITSDEFNGNVGLLVIGRESPEQHDSFENK